MAKEDKIVFCTGGGCTAKLGAGVLSHILEKLPRGEKDPDLLTRIRKSQLFQIIQTLDVSLDDLTASSRTCTRNSITNLYDRSKQRLHFHFVMVSTYSIADIRFLFIFLAKLHT